MVRYDPAIHHRRSLRLQDYDYRWAGAYFVTICTHQREAVFGAIAGTAMDLNAYGQIVAEDWVWLAARFAGVELDAFVVMPNHVHGIIVIAGPESDSRIAPTKPLGGLVGAFKTVSTKHVNEWRETPGAALWQRDFYEHVIRNDEDVQRIREYITANPARWRQDSEYIAPPSP